MAEGIGLENRQAGQTARGFESLYLLHLISKAHNLEINHHDRYISTVAVFFRRTGRGKLNFAVKGAFLVKLQI